MDLDDPPEQAAFRASLRDWLADHAGEAPSPVVRDPDAELPARRAWQGRLAGGGFLGASWPIEYGGAGLSRIEDVIAAQELAAARVPGAINTVGVGMVGPCLLRNGTRSQRERHLAPLLRADELWCQLFSEPSAGSDLAAIRTAARRQEDGSWRVSGQKVWTTLAHHSAFGLLLARTDPSVPKHRGLTAFVVPMDAEGVLVRPLRQVTGAADFCEVFLDDVALDADAAIGEAGDGWRVAVDTLMYERLGVAVNSEARGVSPERLVEALRGAEPAALDDTRMQRAGEVLSEMLALRFSTYRMMSAVQHGEMPGVEAGLMKITAERAITESIALIVDCLGPDALDPGSPWSYVLSFLPGFRAGGGSEDILRNTVGERFLGLEPEPRADKGVPFSELTADGRPRVA